MSSDQAAMSERARTLFGAGSAATQLIAFTAVGVLVFESIPYGLAVGGFAGAGAFLFLPWFLDLSNAMEDDDAGLGTAAGRISRSPGPGVFGLGLEMGAIAMLAVGFVRGPDLLLGVASALTVAVGVYLAGSFVLGRA